MSTGTRPTFGLIEALKAEFSLLDVRQVGSFDPGPWSVAFRIENNIAGLEALRMLAELVALVPLTLTAGPVDVSRESTEYDRRRLRLTGIEPLRWALEFRLTGQEDPDELAALIPQIRQTFVQWEAAGLEFEKHYSYA